MTKSKQNIATKLFKSAFFQAKLKAYTYRIVSILTACTEF